jgi:MoaA/NifB/PqqE/SkfB family radical SAM enzyme
MAQMWWRAIWIALRLYRNPFDVALALQRWRAIMVPVRRSLPSKSALVSGRMFSSFYFPGWPSRAFDRCIEGELNRVLPARDRPASVRVAILAMTRMCALRCEHCVEWDVLNRQEGMSADELRSVASQLRQRGTALVFLSGGEPLQRFDVLLELTTSLAGASDVWVLSSGRGLTAERAQRLRAAGLTGVSLSLDHWDREQHDRFRGRQGTFEAVEHAARHAREAGLVVTLSLCPVRGFVSAENLRRYAEVARGLGASFIQILEPKAVGHYAGQDVALEPAQRQALEDFMVWLNRDPAAHDYPVVAYVDWDARAAGCQGGDQYVYVDTEGSLHACPFCREHAVPLVGQDADHAFSALKSGGCRARSHAPVEKVPA